MSLTGTYKKRDIELYTKMLFNKSRMKGDLCDESFNSELARIARKTDNINLTPFPTKWDRYSVFWAKPTVKEISPGAVGECGFWKNAWHLDTKGLWCYSQLNSANEYIKNYNPPQSGILEKIKGNRKYNPRVWKGVQKYSKWDGVVLITQLAKDVSVGVVGGKELYYEFIRKAGSYYGDKLLLKAHPMHSAGDRERTKEVIRGTGAKYGTLDDLDGCEFALLYNSTISGELFVKNIPIVQYARGYFHNLDAIHFTDGDVKPPKLRDTKSIAEKTAEFLLWKYCIRPFRGSDDVENFTDMLLEFANSSDEFPLPEKYSYASGLL